MDRRTIRMTVEYDGTRYVGWQRQHNGVSVQEKIEDALARHLGHAVKVTAAGRTDSGVHALGQVISFHTPSALPPRGILRGALPHLPDDITLLDAADAPEGFSARRSAVLRCYRYFISNRSIAPAVGASYLTHVPYRLDWATMEAAAGLLEGVHDFRAFRASSCTAARTRLSMQRPVLTRLPESLIMMEFRCQSFLQNMVRIMAGCITECGRGKMSLQQLRDMRDSGQRSCNAITLAPNGLFLYSVHYACDITAHTQQ